MRQKHFRHQGQSLIEVVVAVGVILSVLISIAALVVVNIFGQKSSENRIIAGQLAREGIEVMRNFRDAAYLEKRTLEEVTSVYSESDHFYYYLTEFNNNDDNRWGIQGVASSDWNVIPKLVIDTYGLYTQGAGGDFTGFKRRIIIDSICADTTEPLECVDAICESGEGVCTHRIGYRITSEVQWTENSQDQTIELKEFLYEWR